MSSIAIALKKVNVGHEYQHWIDEIIYANEQGHIVMLYPEHLRSFVDEINTLTERQNKSRDRKRNKELREVVTRLVNKKRIPQELYQSIIDKLDNQRELKEYWR